VDLLSNELWKGQLVPVEPGDLGGTIRLLFYFSSLSRGLLGIFLLLFLLSGGISNFVISLFDFLSVISLSTIQLLEQRFVIVSEKLALDTEIYVPVRIVLFFEDFAYLLEF
jgi:hypothetical protein